ncbi:MAG: putative toxin-antitoxin system toxin component, PIN family [Candidatus Margulisbacteria bacterium]|jgi:putative PIN family toxin of toxin-antitoxin system|nr:putative toxin-antitoxin system toxin component, PIN family [Candidatus Margulisiibacteriota bacterium]
MINVVLDTNVLVSALWTPQGNAAKIVKLMPETILPCFDYHIFQEYRAVLARPKLRFSNYITEGILNHIEYCGMCVLAPPSRIQLPDETDRKFYDVAKMCGAYLITGNLKHFPREPFIVAPAEFLRKI